MSIRAGDYLAALDVLPFVTLDAIAGDGGIVVVAPHPDDESLGCGGLIADAVAAGRAVRLVVVSDGTGSHANSTAWPPTRLRALREAETIEAAAALGLADTCVNFLRLPDRSVPVSGRDFDRAAHLVRAAAKASGASTIFTTWRHDPHCDHRASFAIAEAAQRGLPDVSLRTFPVWGWRLDADTVLDDALPRGGRLRVDHHLARKRRAINAHRSQLTNLIDDDPNGFRLEPEMVALFERPFETFVETAR